MCACNIQQKSLQLLIKKWPPKTGRLNKQKGSTLFQGRYPNKRMIEKLQLLPTILMLVMPHEFTIRRIVYQSFKINIKRPSQLDEMESSLH